MVMSIKQEIHADRRSIKHVNMNGVIITVYVEPPTTIRLLHKNDPIKRIKPKPFSSRPRTVRTRGYDRRAQLLAYAQELRHGNSKQSQWHKNNSRPKPKSWWRWSSSSSRLRISFSRLFYRTKRQWRYESLVSEEQSGVDGSNSTERINSSTRGSERSKSHICSKLRSMLKEISCGWNCNKGY